MASNAAAVSSLLRTAQAAQTKLLAYNDQAAAYDWGLSAKTQDDLNTYLGYLQKRQDRINALPGADTSTTAQKQALALQQKMVDARRSFSSAEIQRATIDTLQGTGSDQNKMDKLNQLMGQAAQTGDANLFQTLDSTRSSLSKSMQDKALAAQQRAEAASKTAETQSYTQQTNMHKMAQDALKTAYESGKPLTNPDGSPVKVQMDASGNPVISNGRLVPDQNGQPLTLNAQSYARLMGLTMQAHAATIQDHINKTGDPNGTYQAALDTLQSDPNYQKFASPEAIARAGATNSNWVTHATQNSDGSFTRTAEQVKLVSTPVIDKNGNITHQLLPEAGSTGANTDKQTGLMTSGGDYTTSYKVGSSPNSPTDTVKVAQGYENLGNTPINIGGGQLVGGYGAQVTAPITNQTPLPNGQPRASQYYLAPDKSGMKSILPLKAIGTTPTGATNYGGTTAADFAGQGAPAGSLNPITNAIQGIGQTGAANFVNDLSATGHIIGNAAETGAHFLHDKLAAAQGLPMVSGAASALGAIGQLAGFGQHQQQVATQNLAAQQWNNLSQAVKDFIFRSSDAGTQARLNANIASNNAAAREWQAAAATRAANPVAPAGLPAYETGSQFAARAGLPQGSLAANALSPGNLIGPVNGTSWWNQ
jgi:hypothetical protein